MLARLSNAPAAELEGALQAVGKVIVAGAEVDISLTALVGAVLHLGGTSVLIPFGHVWLDPARKRRYERHMGLSKPSLQALVGVGASVAIGIAGLGIPMMFPHASPEVGLVLVSVAAVVGIASLALFVWTLRLEESKIGHGPQEPGMLPIFDAGHRLYGTVPSTLRKGMKAKTPQPYGDVDQVGASMIVEAARAGVIQIYGRQGPGLKREKITADEAHTTAIDPEFGEGDRCGLPIDLAVKRSDLKKVLRWYETA
jgi:hypothetical protein